MVLSVPLLLTVATLAFWESRDSLTLLCLLSAVQSPIYGVYLCHPMCPMLLSVVALSCFTSLSAAGCSGTVLSHVSHCCSLKRLSIFQGVSHLLHDVGLHHLRYSTSTHWGGFVLFQGFHCNSVEWLCIFPGVLLPLTVIAQHCFRYTFLFHWSGSESSQVVYY